MNVLKITPGHGVTCEEIENSLEAFQTTVGGYIEVIPLTNKLVVVCNEEGKLKELPVSAVLLDPEMQPCDMLHGDLIVCRTDLKGEFADIEPWDRDELRLHLYLGAVKKCL